MRAYRIAYDGRDYHGFQRQPEVPTVSDAILDTLRTLDVVDDRSVPAGYAAAGRTDAGVSATHQTVAFEAPGWLVPSALNSGLPAEVRAWASAEVPAGFHATHDAVAREYTYYLHAGSSPQDRSTAEPEPLRTASGDGVPADRLARAREAANALAGEHDFHNLTPDTAGTVRDLDLTCERAGRFLVVVVRADGFPRQLVRRLVTVVDERARGEADHSRIERLLRSEPVDGPEGIAPAPPEPLALTDVAYPDVAFTVDERANASATAVFDARHRRHASLARVAGRLRDR
ncbi:MAG: tRNA pseudouridine(38-40) synthase TruA [Haloarculaceae archaeon]